MTRRLGILCVVVLAGAGMLMPASAQPIERDGDTFTIRAEDDVADAATAAEQFALAQAAENSRNFRRAIAGYRKVERRFPLSPQAPAALFRMGQLQEESGDFNRAFDSYQRLIDRYPDSPDFNDAIESQFQIANLYLEGERQRLLGVPTLPSMERAREMFESVVANGPFTKFAPLAQLGIGLTYQKQRMPEEAIRAFQVVLDRYEDSDAADDALFQTGMVWLEQTARGSYDTTAALRAADAFEDFLIRFPNSEKAAQARQNLQKLQGRQTSDAMGIAKFYDRTRQYRAAAIYYSEVIRQEPGSDAARTAAARIDELRNMVGQDALEIPAGSPQDATAARVARRMQADVDTAARPDFVGPPAPEVAPEVAPSRPAMRTSPADLAPLEAFPDEMEPMDTLPPVPGDTPETE